MSKTLWKHSLILDDEKSLNDLPSNLKENLLQASSMIGLTDMY